MKTYKSIILTLIFTILMSVTVMAEVNSELEGYDSSQIIYDDAELLSNEDELKIIAQEIADTYDIYVALHTVLDITEYGYTINDIDYYVNDWYDTNDFPEDAVFFVVDPTNRKYCIITKGSAISIVNDTMLDNLEESVIHDLSNSFYEHAMLDFAKTLNSNLSFRRTMACCICLFAPIILGLVVIGIMYLKSKSTHITKPTTSEYINHEKTRITRRDERYIRTATQVRNVESSSGGGGGGGGSVSSGNSHSGGRKGSF